MHWVNFCGAAFTARSGNIWLPARPSAHAGLRREEVAQLANISPTWYTWLEQGRGGAPSREVLGRIAGGLRLTTPEREHLFILAFGHPPETRLIVSDDITPRLQRVLDAFPVPAIVKTVAWDVIAWNDAAAARADRLRPAAARRTQYSPSPCLPTALRAARWKTGHPLPALSSAPFVPMLPGQAHRRKTNGSSPSSAVRARNLTPSGAAMMWPGRAKALSACIIRSLV
jgi:transcriptional regulator with XRE-family HTH domain